MEQMEALLSLDDELRETLVTSGFSIWHTHLRDVQKKGDLSYEVTPEVIQEIKDGVIVTGSMAEGMSSARFFRLKQIGCRLDGEIEVDIMFHVMVLDASGQEELVEPIPDKLGYFKVKKSTACTKYIPRYIRHRYEDIFEDSGEFYLSGATIKEKTDDLIRIRDSDNEIIRTAAQLLDVNVEDVTSGSKSEVNGPAVTLSLQVDIKNGPRLLTEADGVSCICLPAWPVGEEEFLTRRRDSGYPAPRLLSEVVHAGVHLVPKMTSSGSDPEEWRLSFSVAEKILADSRNHGQRLTYMIFKSMYYAHIKSIEIQNTTLPSYFAKTIMMWSMEEIPDRKWTKDDMEHNLQYLFRKVSECLSSGARYLKHYFIPEMNLLDPYTQDHSDLLNAAAAKMLEISKNLSLFYLPVEKIENVTRQMGELLKIVKKVNDWFELYQGEHNSIMDIVKKLLASQLPAQLKDEKIKPAVDVVKGITQIVRLFDKSKTTRNNLDAIDSALGEIADSDHTKNKSKRGYQEDDLD